MNRLDGTTFPEEPHARMTVASGTTSFRAGIRVNGDFTVEFNNGTIATFVDNGNVVLVEINGLTDTEIIITGDLTTLSLSSTQLTSFYATGLSNLTSLDLLNNQLTSFGATGLSNLTWLNLDHNQLTSFYGTGLPNLTTLLLSWNPLTSFNGTGLSNLTTLRLNSNQLTSFNGTGLASLTTLELMGNQLTEFNATGLSSLMVLVLSTNQLTTVDVRGLYNLTSLALINNHNLSSIILPNFADVPSGSGGFRTLNIRNTALANMTSVDSPEWQHIITNLPTRHTGSRGNVIVSNVQLRDAIIAALADKHWNGTSM